MSLVSLCLLNKMLLPVNCLSVPYLSLRFPQRFLGECLRLQRLIFHLPCCWGASPKPLGEMIPPGANGQFDLGEGLILLESGGEGLGCTMEPGEVQELVRGAEHFLQTGKNPGLK
jgi:hypothetical protein